MILAIRRCKECQAILPSGKICLKCIQARFDKKEERRWLKEARSRKVA